MRLLAMLGLQGIVVNIRPPSFFVRRTGADFMVTSPRRFAKYGKRFTASVTQFLVFKTTPQRNAVQNSNPDFI